MENNLQKSLDEICDKQREAAAAIDEIRKRDEINLSDIEAIKNQQIEILDKFDVILTGGEK